MARPANVIRIVLSGGLPNGEIWTCGFFLGASGQTTPAALATLAQQVANALVDSVQGAAMSRTIAKFFNSMTNWKKTSAYYYAGGSTKADALGEYIWPTPKAGNLNNGVPEQCAVVLSLRSAHPGRSYRGRMYLPCTGASLQVDGQLVSTDVDDVAGAWGQNLSRLGGDIDPIPLVVSDHLGLATPITSVVMDSRIDTMRSRAKSASVDYTKTVVLN